jgi:glycosyltransferase involved in cell wall biosynthesis
MIGCTVITFSYNQKPELLDASIRSSIAMGAKQVILVDDGSDPPIKNEWGVELVRHDANRGIPAAYATALDRVRCSHVIRSMSDDEQSPDKIRELAACEFRWDWPPAVYHDHTIGTPTNQRVQRYHGGECDRLEVDNQFSGAATVISAELLREIGPHPSHLRHMQDWWLHLRIHWLVGWVHVPRVLSHHGDYPHGMHHRINEEAGQERAWIRERVAERGRSPDRGYRAAQREFIAKHTGRRY